MPIKQCQHCLVFLAPKQGLLEITKDIAQWIARQDISTGLLTMFLRHTSASILIQENADPDVIADLEEFFANLAPEGNSLYRHSAEGPDDMPAHIKGALTQSQLAIPIAQGAMMLGTWQGIYLFEHRRMPRDREIVLHLTGD